MSNTYDILQKCVNEAQCKPGWSFWLDDGEDDSRVLIIQLRETNNYDHSKPFTVNHIHPVPCTTFNERSWRRWIFEKCLATMNHEIGETLNFNGIRPFVPMHGPGEDPYTVHEWRSEEDALTTQDGSLREGPV